MPQLLVALESNVNTSWEVTEIHMREVIEIHTKIHSIPINNIHSIPINNIYQPGQIRAKAAA